MGLCPFHHEKSPSFSVSPDKQLFYCFGCGKGGNALRFVMDHDGYSFPEAVEQLALQAGLALPEQRRSSPHEQTQRQEQFQILQRASEHFVEALRQAPHARAYLQQRRLPQQIIEQYHIGYAPEGYGFMQRCFGVEQTVRKRLAEVGLVSEDARGGGDRFRGRIIFPIRDRRGRVVGFGGRTLGDGEPKYLNTAETPLFHKSSLLYGYAEHRESIRKQRRLIVVEGYMDVLALAGHGLTQGVAPLGTAIGESQIRTILQLCNAPLFCFDGDRAGRKAAWRALEQMMPLIDSEHKPRFLFLPEGEDPDSLIRKEGRDAFLKRIQRDARSVLQSWIDGMRSLAGRGVEGRAKMAKQAHNMLITMHDRYLAQAWQQEAERATGIAITPHTRKKEGREKRRITSARNIATKNISLRFIKALLQNPRRIVELLPQDEAIFLDNDHLQSLYTRAFSARQHYREAPEGIVRELAAAFPESAEISRWAMVPEQKQPDEDGANSGGQSPEYIEEHEYQAILATLRMEQIQRQLRSGAVSLNESIALQQRLRELSRQRQAYHDE